MALRFYFIYFQSYSLVDLRDVALLLHVQSRSHSLIFLQSHISQPVSLLLDISLRLPFLRNYIFQEIVQRTIEPAHSSLGHVFNPLTTVVILLLHCTLLSLLNFSSLGIEKGGYLGFSERILRRGEVISLSLIVRLQLARSVWSPRDLLNG